MYDQFYGLSGRPFQLTPDPQYYFESGTHRKALSYLGYGLAQGEGFIVITGEVGAGKSTLVGHLMRTIDKSRLTASSIVTSQLDGSDMVQMAAESFGIASHGRDKADILKAIENHLHAEARAGRRCLLIVDEAQNLEVDAIEELRMLSNFQLGAQALLQIFLLGQPEFRDLVQNSAELEQLRQRIIATHHLEAMEADEIEPYIVHRLSRAGWTGRPQITSDAFAKLYAETGGVPRKLNTLMSRVLLMGAVEQLDLIDADLVSAVVADMAGKPFEYSAPMASAAPMMASAAPVVAIEIAEPEEAQAAEDHAEATVIESEVPEPISMMDETKEEPTATSPGFITALHIAEAEQSELAAIEPKIEAEAASDAVHIVDTAMQGRVATLERHLSEQDVALRRVLAMIIDWMDQESSVGARLKHGIRAA
jgi:general secretion pathway protein A